MSKLQSGDRVAYAAKFLRNIGVFSGAMPQRRGTFRGIDQRTPTHGYVWWDDTQARIDAREGYFAEDDYRDHVVAHGEMVALSAIAKVGSPRFALNCI